ncbi:kinase-like protein [Sodiomyces alkalinus F11]|uniref:Kinase-like protein n=1 Tax=Sodiomyces alkalinus (strain CBS 110278 / VKM F-3762 / F11) TaxID=1314773 RepID=A0A3N2PXS3_SODAK|nr:kinase-like protein [Sodiomyces alkalinus F11]ROT39297.1 kinase-like protein [Sodiomyces alkalinus F11]
MDTSDTPTMDVRLLPDISKPVRDFRESSFFRSASSSSPTPQLPPPAIVRKEGQVQGRKTVKFEHLNLVVKFGDPSWVRLEEAQALRAIGQLFPAKEVPVPELFGWRVDEGQNFIYMSLIHGPTLGEGWSLLNQEEKKSICGQLSEIVASLRRIQQPSTRPFIGSINGGPVQDIYFRGGHEAGPFHSVPSFNDWVQLAALPGLPISERPADPYRLFLPDSCAVYFSHGDLHLQNIIVSDTPGCRRIIGIVDWEQAGWYPEYWEYCKMTIAGPYNHEWHEDQWADSIVTPCKEEWTAFSEYWMWRRP